MTEFVPTEAQVRDWYATWPTTTTNTRVVPEYLAEFDRWLAQHDAQVKAEALRDAVRDMRAAWSGNWNLPDPRDPEVAYSVDRWLEVRADRIEKEADRDR